MPEVKLKENGPASYMAGGYRFLPGNWIEVDDRRLAIKLGKETNSDGESIFEIRDLTTNDGGQTEPEGTQKEGSEDGDEGASQDESDRFKELDEQKTVPELKEMADKLDIDYRARVRKDELIEKIIEVEKESEE